MKGHFLAALVRSGRERWVLVHGASGRVLATDLHTAFDSVSRRTGLLRHTAWPSGAALIIAPCQAVHTVGMRFAIDVLMVDRAGRVVRVRERVKRWRVVAALTAFAAIELPAGTLAGSVQVGDTLSVTSAAATPGVEPSSHGAASGWT